MLHRLIKRVGWNLVSSVCEAQPVAFFFRERKVGALLHIKRRFCVVNKKKASPTSRPHCFFQLTEFYVERVRDRALPFFFRERKGGALLHIKRRFVGYNKKKAGTFVKFCLRK